MFPDKSGKSGKSVGRGGALTQTFFVGRRKKTFYFVVKEDTFSKKKRSTVDVAEDVQRKYHRYGW